MTFDLKKQPNYLNITLQAWTTFGYGDIFWKFKIFNDFLKNYFRRPKSFENLKNRFLHFLNDVWHQNTAILLQVRTKRVNDVPGDPNVCHFKTKTLGII